MRNRLGLTLLTCVPTQPTCTPRCNCETAQQDDISHELYWTADFTLVYYEHPVDR